MNLAKNLKIDSVSRLNPSPPLHVKPTPTAAEAVALMHRDQVGCVLVCQEDRLLGIFTERDLMRRVLAAGKPLTLPVAECMTTDPVAVHPKEPIAGTCVRWKRGAIDTCPSWTTPDVPSECCRSNALFITWSNIFRLRFITCRQTLSPCPTSVKGPDRTTIFDPEAVISQAQIRLAKGIESLTRLT